MRILTLTSCTAQKTVQHELALTREHFARRPAWVQTRERELAARGLRMHPQRAAAGTDPPPFWRAGRPPARSPSNCRAA